VVIYLKQESVEAGAPLYKRKIIYKRFFTFCAMYILPSPKTKYIEYHKAFINQILQLTTCINWAVQL
jgi:hypothetical protein